ncbi:hypothetical protein AAF712_014378 [Marasmius tenuissimus]|uniref:Cytochrome P450 n=1 Tax=Marasmius tenuissimus TaxID=585030 RepID=A0ABR2ZD46_9AGAR
MEAEDPKKALNPAEALSQMATIIFAGHETTAFTMNWVLYELSKNPKDQEKLLHEITQMREQTGNEGEFIAKDLEGMVFLNAVIRQEALRLHPILPELIREAVVDDVIPLDLPVVDASGSVLREIPVTKGQRIVSSIYNYNRLKKVWGEDADDWRPERFLDARPPTLGIFGNLLTFGAGVRACIGWRFAMLEIQSVIAALVESFTFELPEGTEIDSVRLSVASPVVKGDWNAGARLPLKIALRQA